MSAAVVTLCVAIATFILQEGITNIIHGLIFRIFSKVHNGDRIEIVVDGVSYTGIVAKRNIRQVVIRDIQTNAEIIIPNHKIDLSVIKNTYNGKRTPNTYVVELPVSYSDAESAAISNLIKSEIHKAIDDCSYTVSQTPSIFINFKEYYVGYSFYVITYSIENNFKACTEIKETLMQRLAEKGIHIPYNTVDVNVKGGLLL